MSGPGRLSGRRADNSCIPDEGEARPRRAAYARGACPHGRPARGRKTHPFVFSTMDGVRPFSGFSKAKSALDKHIDSLTDQQSRSCARVDAIARQHLAEVERKIADLNAMRHIYVDFRDRDLGGYVADAQKAVATEIKFPPGYYVVWSGQFEYLERAKARLQTVVPVTILIIFLLLYLNFRRVTETLIVMLSVPFALVGGLWWMWWLGFNLSVAVAVGFIALAGVAAETGVVMLIYLDQAFTDLEAQRAAEGRSFTHEDLHDAIMSGGAERVRPLMMTVAAIMAGLLPIMWSHGTGAEVMQRIAVPMIGGMVSSTLLTLIVIPAIYAVVKAVSIRSPHLAPAIGHS